MLLSLLIALMFVALFAFGVFQKSDTGTPETSTTPTVSVDNYQEIIDSTRETVKKFEQNQQR